MAKLSSKIVSKSSTTSQISSGSVSKQTRITKQQLDILYLIYRYRFVSTKHVKQVLGREQIQQAQQRLNTLLGKGYIGRNFSNLDRLTGTYASYYLLPAGMKVLKQNKDAFEEERYLSQQTLHNIYKDKNASPRFIKHQLDMGDIRLELIRLYGTDRLRASTKSQLVIYEGLPESLPDAYILLQDNSETNNTGKSYFLEYLENSIPFWVYRNRIKAYEEYVYAGTWKETMQEALPKILLVCESPTLQRRMTRFLNRYMENCYEDMTFYVTNTETLKTCQSPHEPIWREISYTELEEVKIVSLA